MKQQQLFIRVVNFERLFAKANFVAECVLTSNIAAFMESAECLMELDRKPAVKRCHDETLVEIETANMETGIAMAAKLDRMCG